MGNFQVFQGKGIPAQPQGLLTAYAWNVYQDHWALPGEVLRRRPGELEGRLVTGPLLGLT